MTHARLFDESPVVRSSDADFFDPARGERARTSGESRDHFFESPGSGFSGRSPRGGKTGTCYECDRGECSLGGPSGGSARSRSTGCPSRSLGSHSSGRIPNSCGGGTHCDTGRQESRARSRHGAGTGVEVSGGRCGEARCRQISPQASACHPRPSSRG